MPKPKRGNLRDINVKEVSLVDLPANKQPFLFFKRQGAKESQFVKAKKKIKIEIESNGLVGGTKVSVNGDTLDKLRSFDFSFYGDDPKSTVHASYSIISEVVDGFSHTETFYLSKGEIVMNRELLESLQKYLGKDDIDFEKKVDEEEIQKAINLIAEHYQDSFPEDLENAVGVIVKRAASSYAADKADKDVEKAGAKFSKDVLKKLKAVLAAVEALKGILPDIKESTEKADASDDETKELTKQITELTESVAKLDPDKKAGEKSSVNELTKALKEVSERVKAMEKDGATKKSIDGDDDNDGDSDSKVSKDGVFNWSSLTGQGKSD